MGMKENHPAPMVKPKNAFVQYLCSAEGLMFIGNVGFILSAYGLAATLSAVLNDGENNQIQHFFSSK
jgi:hypothetical protein